MALFTREEVIKRSGQETVLRSAGTILKGIALSFSEDQSYDIFMSHSSLDAKEILGLKLCINDIGYSVYVDWIEDPALDRTKVTKDTARYLQARMRKCKCLFFALSANSKGSIWMPWELGYFDGFKGRVAILPVAEKADGSYSGQEYLGLYPYVDKTGSTLWIQDGIGVYVSFKEWLTGKNPSKH